MSFSRQLRDLLAHARGVARLTEHRKVSRDHALIAISEMMHAGDTAVANVFLRFDLDSSQLYRIASTRLLRGPGNDDLDLIPYSDSLRIEIRLAQQFALVRERDVVETSDLLLGMLWEGGDSELERRGLDYLTVLGVVRELPMMETADIDSAELLITRMTPGAIHVLENARVLARQDGDEPVRTYHLLQAIASEESDLRSALSAQGISFTAITQLCGDSDSGGRTDEWISNPWRYRTNGTSVT